MQENYALELIQNGKRIDGRKFDEFRKIEIETGIIKNAEGSARVKLGDTEIIVGVKLNTGTPFADTPNEGTLMVNTEFSPIASPDFEAGPPSEDAVELSRVVDRGIREAHTIDLEKLVITAGEKVWTVFVDIHIINHAGNLLDAAALAAVAALHSAQIPKLDGDKVLRGEFSGKLPVEFKPITVTVCKIGKDFILDPLLEEEKVLDSKLSVAVRDDGRICALQKQGTKEILYGELEKFIDTAVAKSKELRNSVK